MTYVPGTQFDERRNTSRVWPVPPGASIAVIEALARWRAANPAHAQWIADGHPTLTADEHVARFGARYKKGT